MAIKIVGTICGLSWLFLGVSGLAMYFNPTLFEALLKAYPHTSYIAWISTAMLIFLALVDYSRRPR